MFIVTRRGKSSGKVEVYNTDDGTVEKLDYVDALRAKDLSIDVAGLYLDKGLLCDLKFEVIHGFDKKGGGRFITACDEHTRFMKFENIDIWGSLLLSGVSCFDFYDTDDIYRDERTMIGVLDYNSPCNIELLNSEANNFIINNFGAFKHLIFKFALLKCCSTSSSYYNDHISFRFQGKEYYMLDYDESKLLLLVLATVYNNKCTHNQKLIIESSNPSFPDISLTSVMNSVSIYNINGAVYFTDGDLLISIKEDLILNILNIKEKSMLNVKNKMFGTGISVNELGEFVVDYCESLEINRSDRVYVLPKNTCVDNLRITNEKAKIKYDNSYPFELKSVYSIQGKKGLKSLLSRMSKFNHCESVVVSKKALNADILLLLSKVSRNYKIYDIESAEETRYCLEHFLPEIKGNGIDINMREMLEKFKSGFKFFDEVIVDFPMYNPDNYDKNSGDYRG